MTRSAFSDFFPQKVFSRAFVCQRCILVRVSLTFSPHVILLLINAAQLRLLSALYRSVDGYSENKFIALHLRPYNHSSVSVFKPTGIETYFVVLFSPSDGPVSTFGILSHSWKPHYQSIQFYLLQPETVPGVLNSQQSGALTDWSIFLIAAAVSEPAYYGDLHYTNR